MRIDVLYLLLVIGCVLQLGWLSTIGWHARHVPGGRRFAFFCAMGAVWSSLVGAMAITPPDTARFLLSFKYIFIALGSVSLFLFVSQRTGRLRRLSPLQQRALEILVRNAERLEPSTAAAWLRTVARHEALAVRSQRVEALTGAEAPPEGPAHDAASTEDRVLSFDRVTRSAEALRRFAVYGETPAAAVVCNGGRNGAPGVPLRKADHGVVRAITRGPARAGTRGPPAPDSARRAPGVGPGRVVVLQARGAGHPNAGGAPVHGAGPTSAAVLVLDPLCRDPAAARAPSRARHRRALE